MDASLPTQEAVIIFEEVSIAFDDNKVLDRLSFSLLHGQTKALFGVAGAGKTLVLKLAMGLIKPDSGKVTVLGEEVSSMREHDLFALRRRIGMIFQESALFDSLNVEDNVSFRMREEHVAPEECERRVREALHFVELEHTMKLFPSELSGGMRRRVAIARAIVNEPELLLYDSPTAGRFDTAENHMVEVPRGSDWDSKTSFLVLKDGVKIFEGSAEELATSGDPYIREYLTP